jgi:5S rRNA maturation endonuclease (ribonuclease M5)
MTKLEKLQKTTSLSEFATLLNYQPKTISYILYKIPEKDKYNQFEILKKNGEKRKIQAPINKLKLLQRRLANLLNECFDEICNKNKKAKSLSHGFRKKHSIITNAKKHKNRRYVFNVDLQNFFPSINFGRVIGFFIKNNHFNLMPEVATVIAQISCHDNELPQGSPCSPIISNLIGHLLDIRMVNLAKKTKCTYSRYADDLTFSTNKKEFPEKIAIKKNESDWVAGKALTKEIEKVGFSINAKKTSMQYRTSRQMTTGLIVNKKINVKKEYYKKARAMCHNLFKSDNFYIDKNSEKEGTLKQLEGIISFIYQVKSPHYIGESKKNKKPTAITALYRKFLFYKHFFSIDKPLIVCEGKTDIIYLKCALNQLENKYQELAQRSEKGINFKIKFLNISKNFKEVLNVAEGTTGLLSLINMYKDGFKHFKGKGKKYPVIIVLDNDKATGDIKSRIQEQLKLNNDKTADKKKQKQKLDTNKYYHFAHNLYILFVIHKKDKEIEDLFDEDILNTKIGGKTFSRKDNINMETEYSKIIFAEKVIKAKQKNVNFDGFKPVFNKVENIIEE